MNFVKIISIITVLCTISSAHKYDNSIELLIKGKNYPAGSAGIFFKSVKTGKILAALNPDKKYIPASVNKLVTGAAAFEVLGANYRFNTSVYIDSTFLRDNGVVYGNLYVKGGGDPGFTAERTWLFAKHLSHLGLKEIRKDIVLDDHFFDESRDGPGYGDDKSSRAYNAPIGALSASFNSLGIHVAPGDSPGSPVRVTPFPYVKDIEIVSTAKTVFGEKSPGIKVETQQVDGKTAIFVYGGMRVGEKPRYIYRKTWETCGNFGRVILGKLEECGIKVGGKLREGKVPDGLEPILTFNSLKLKRYINYMFKYSNNFAAEMIFKTIGAAALKEQGSWEAGSEAVKKWWRGEKLPGKLQIVNGSGMGDGNRISPRQVGALLENVCSKKSYYMDYASALSISGIDGTLKDRFKNSPLKGIVRAKTGTLNNYGVSNLAGYLFLPDDTIIFSILINSTKSSQFSHWTLQQDILEKVFALVKSEKTKEKKPENSAGPGK